MKKPTLVIAVGEKKKPRKSEYENEITLPEGFEHPPAEDGEEFEAVATVRRKKGKFCVVALDGVPMKDEKEREDDPEEDEPSIGVGAKTAMGGGY